MKIGFIGAGNMAGAMMRGMVGSGSLQAADIMAYDIKGQAVDALCGELGIQAAKDIAAVAGAAGMIVLAVKPQVLRGVVEQLSPLVDGRKVLVSIAAGVSLDTLGRWLGKEVPTIRVMPNVNMMVGCSMSALCTNSLVDKGTEEMVLGLLRSVGAAVPLAEKDLPAFCAIAGCSPAYTYLFIDALSRAAVKHGLPKKAATEIAAQAVMGSGKMVLENGLSPWDLVDMVCSPGGTTVAGLLAMQEHGFQAAVAKGVDAVVERDLEMQAASDAAHEGKA